MRLQKFKPFFNAIRCSQYSQQLVKFGMTHAWCRETLHSVNCLTLRRPQHLAEFLCNMSCGYLSSPSDFPSDFHLDLRQLTKKLSWPAAQPA